ncbi:hypothetical protein CDAR_252291 [Caerostris darwini]|uniref:Uncharacterized protein n=1 Tax=Caerostris darwini TaxID=1538125 RepID=A0AAV4QFQ0_9ARAC|nr:hypothetical protein CDAR_252291 [Caerostris darwini]
MSPKAALRPHASMFKQKHPDKHSKPPPGNKKKILLPVLCIIWAFTEVLWHQKSAGQKSHPVPLGIPTSDSATRRSASGILKPYRYLIEIPFLFSFPSRTTHPLFGGREECSFIPPSFSIQKKQGLIKSTQISASSLYTSTEA